MRALIATNIWPARLPTPGRVEPDEVPYRVNAVDTRAALWPARRMAELVLEARTELIDPALYSRADAPMGAVRT